MEPMTRETPIYKHRQIMKMDEKSIDAALENAFIQNREFQHLFLTLIDVNPDEYEYHWSRSDNPWSRIEAVVIDEETGEPEKITRDSETDVIVILQHRHSDKRLAIHIENKLANGHFTKYQPQLYPIRAESWKNTDKFQNYSDFVTVLVAPDAFYHKYSVQAKPFDHYVSYESLKDYLPEVQVHLQQFAA